MDLLIYLLRKKLRQDLGHQFSHLSEEDLKVLVPNKEEMSTMKLVTHAGYNMTIYSLGKNPAFFELDHEVFPTVYTLWKFPDLLPVFTTWPPVFNKLSGGADLMLPGLVLEEPVQPNTFSHIRKGEACSVKLFGNGAPVAVGRTAMSGSDMYGCAMRGKGIGIMHTFRDLLWALGDKQDPPLIDDSVLVAAIQKIESKDAEGATVAGDNETSQRVSPSSEDIDSQPQGVTGASLGGENNQEVGTIENTDSGDSGKCSQETMGGDRAREIREDTNGDNIEDMERGEGAEDSGKELIGDDIGAVGGKLGEIGLNGDLVEGEETEGAGVSIQDHTDALLIQCFLSALKSSVNRKSDLPLLTSTFYRNHMLKFCPQGETLDVKKSSYKKLGKFLQMMQKQGFIKVKELSKGSDSVTEINREHPELRAFVVPDLPPQVEPPSAEEKGFTPPEITEMYTVTAAALPLFREVTPNTNKGDALTVPEVRQILQTYVKKNNLQQGSSVELDPVLSSLSLHKGEYAERLRWEELFGRVFNKLSPACRFVLPGQPPVIRKGKLEPISMKLATRAGNKKVTLIHHLEPYGISPDELAHTVQVAMACSTSVSQLPGKGAGTEVLVQGNQVHYVYQLLTEKYKVPKKYIQGYELAPKSGKKKR